MQARKIKAKKSRELMMRKVKSNDAKKKIKGKLNF